MRTPISELLQRLSKQRLLQWTAAMDRCNGKSPWPRVTSPLLSAPLTTKIKPRHFWRGFYSVTLSCNALTCQTIASHLSTALVNSNFKVLHTANFNLAYRCSSVDRAMLWRCHRTRVRFPPVVRTLNGPTVRRVGPFRIRFLTANLLNWETNTPRINPCVKWLQWH